jgi:hypothetical protein
MPQQVPNEHLLVVSDKLHLCVDGLQESLDMPRPADKAAAVEEPGGGGGGLLQIEPRSRGLRVDTLLRTGDHGSGGARHFLRRGELRLGRGEGRGKDHLPYPPHCWSEDDIVGI